MTIRGRRAGALACATLGIALAGFSSQRAVAQADQDVAPSAAASAVMIAQHMVLQQGLAIGFANVVLQSQFELIGRVSVNRCEKLKSGGAAKLLSAVGNKLVVRIYFDTACTKIYLDAHLDQTGSTDNSLKLSESITVRSPANAVLGTLTLKATGTTKPHDVLQLSGTGTFTRTGGPVAHLSLDCAYPMDLNKPFLCHGGVAQKFTSLARDLASVTPITLTPKVAGSSYSATFKVTSSKNVTGKSGALNITAPSITNLAISGAATNYGTSTATGSLKRFEIFPTPGSTWTVTDTAHNVKFTITLGSTTPRTYTGKVTRAQTTAVLATFKLDQSGSGSVTYSDHTTAKIYSWVLAN